MRHELNKDAWDILNHDEKTALSLSLGHGKSTWESGEIMNRAHFKYLEIQKRAKKFLEIFTYHFEKYRCLFPEELILSFAFREYFNLIILERKNISQSTKVMEDPSYRVAHKRTKFLIHEIEKLKNNNTESAQDLYGLIMDFDRWNNFRVLPFQVQEPSAFKRRNKTRNIKHIKNVTALPQFSILKIIEKFNYSGKYKKLYLPIISLYLEGGYRVISIKDNPSNIRKISEIGLFVFSDRATADEFAGLVSGYFLAGVKTCKLGQRFWPEFRVLLEKTRNHKELENIHKSRSYLDHAFFNLDKRKVNKRKDKAQPGEERASEEDFYNPTKVK